ncbi:erythropoietin-like [Osmerus mordax]|uniref:erythropoietin-like n=1 Tax=Osmerus mordax TaxID=8014 RepID=UPI00350F8B1C
MILQRTGPSTSTPLRPICDLRVLDHFVLEALDTQKALRGCKAGCTVTASFAVPPTSVDFVVWETKDVGAQVEEVWWGLSLLSQALAAVSTSVRNPVLQDLLASDRRNLQSLGRVLRSLHFQGLSSAPASADHHTPAPASADHHTPAPASADHHTPRLSSLPELLAVHINFLRGKVRLLLAHAPACQQRAS